MAEEFKVRRDSSSNNVPTVGYNEGVDAQDIILFGACKVTEQLVTDALGMITLSNSPVSISGETFIDNSGVRRARDLSEDISVVSTGGVAYYAGAVSPVEKTLKVYSNYPRTVVASGVNVVVTYYKRVPIKVNENGELVIEGQATGTQDVNVTNDVLNVSIKSSDVSLSTKEKIGVMLKKEGAIAAGTSANPLTVTIGDGTKDMYITSIMAYYDGTGADTDPFLSFWFDIVDTAGTSTGFANMTLPPKTKAPLQINFGETGLKIPAGGSIRFRVSSSWTLNTIHVIGFGWQYA